MSVCKPCEQITVYYDGACPRCVRDREFYEKLCPTHKGSVEWFDITGQDGALRQLGIDPKQAMLQLHVKDQNGHILVELDAYILLMRKSIWMRPLAMFLNIRPVKHFFSKVYHFTVRRRLKKAGRI